MEELDRTLDAYEHHTDHFVEKFLGTVLADQVGDEFREAMPGGDCWTLDAAPTPRCSRRTAST